MDVICLPLIAGPTGHQCSARSYKTNFRLSYVLPTSSLHYCVWLYWPLILLFILAWFPASLNKLLWSQNEKKKKKTHLGPCLPNWHRPLSKLPFFMLWTFTNLFFVNCTSPKPLCLNPIHWHFDGSRLWWVHSSGFIGSHLCIWHCWSQTSLRTFLTLLVMF